MRVWIAAASIVLTCCAWQRAPEGVPKGPMKIDATNIARAQRMGYKIVNKNRTPLYCQRAFITGSHLAQKTLCLTEAEWLQEQEAASQAMDSVNRVPRAKGSGGG